MSSRKKRRERLAAEALMPANPQGASLQHMQAQVSVSTSPVPPPDVLAGYAGIAPNLVDRIVALAETEAVHRRQLEVRSLETRRSVALRAQVYAASIALAGFGLAGYCVHHGQPWAAGIIAALNVGTIVTAFLRRS